MPRAMAEEVRTTKRHPIPEMIVLGAIASAIGIAVGLSIDWFPTAASTQAEPIDTLWDVLVIVSVPVFVGVTAVILYCVYRFRAKPGEENKDGPPIHGNTTLEVVWTVLPALLIFGLCAYAYVVLTDIEEARADEMRINVTGQQFAWSFEYPQGEGDPVRSNELYVPQGRSINFHIRTADVIHSFWVPNWRMKIDSPPGITTTVRVTPNRLGRYPVVCAELCGLGHAFMRQHANVVEPEEFERWLEEKREGRTGVPAGEEGEGEEVDGLTLFRDGVRGSTACGACHALADAQTTGGTGPDLDEVLPERSTEEIERAIVDPEAEITPGFQPGIMPPYGDTFTDAELAELVAYLERVTR
jgi:cytochrome c oxidase subunit II